MPTIWKGWFGGQRLQEVSGPPIRYVLPTARPCCGVMTGAESRERAGSAAPRAYIPRERCLPSLQPLMQYSTLLRPCNAVIHCNNVNRSRVIFIILLSSGSTLAFKAILAPLITVSRGVTDETIKWAEDTAFSLISLILYLHT